MVKIGGGSRSGGSGSGRSDDNYLKYMENRTANAPVEAKAYHCTTKYEGMNRNLAVRDLSPNGWRPIDNQNDVKIELVFPTKFMRPHGATNKLGLILLGKKSGAQ
ncbi:hypothetical protein J1N35_005230 [Gossypium stocksii]|uniref:Uncharacterized protein n=1 Tax=Gossypium stocksii TaxID=47602 RepID=A0A9D3WFE7_9ROSI|nr:hypothetical protein J1N35_005230 [Gossypium stocksii]